MNRTVQVVIVEDDPNDAYFIQRAFQQAGVKAPAHICTTAQDAIHYLEGSGEYADRARFPFPNLLVTDIKMPGMNGLELLRWIRDHPEFQVIPTVVMSSSHQTEDVKCAYCLGANAYLCKPADANMFRNMFAALLQFWAFCEVPPTDSPLCHELTGTHRI